MPYLPSPLILEVGGAVSVWALKGWGGGEQSSFMSHIYFDPEVRI